MTKRSIPQHSTVDASSGAAPVNALKGQFLTDMELAGMGPLARKRYLFAVERLLRHYWCPPADLTEQQVRDYLLERPRQGPAQGTFQVMQYGLRFFFRETMGQDWKLFKRK